MYLIMGIGISNIAVIKKLKELSKEFIVVCKSDEVNEAIKYHNSVIDFEMIKYLNLDKIKYAIKSPGIPYYDKWVKYLKNKHKLIINEIELAYILSKKKGNYVGVSGSVGKSSVVSLLYELIKTKTNNVILAGNIGVPLISYLDDINEDTIIILEVSSFQLDDFMNMKFDISLLLNIYDNHLDFYKNKTLYYKSKFRLTNNQSKNNYFIVNLDNELTKKYISSQCYNSKLVDYKTGFKIVNNYLYYYKKRILNLDNYALKGNHNLDNLKAVICVMNLLNIELDETTLSNFKTLPYHLQETEINQLTIVNDSKSTSTSSLKSAIETYQNKRLILLFGGYNKNLNFSFLNQYNFKYLICFGDLSKTLEDNVNIDIKFDRLYEACIYAFKVANKDDVILFSPGCASFDEFKNYIERAKTFDKYVKEYYHD